MPAYDPQAWINDDPATPLSAERLLHMEEGIDDGNAAVDAHVASSDHHALNVPVNPVLANVFDNVQASLGFLEINKAEKSLVVTRTGTVTIDGTKTFTSPPVVPTPTAGNHAANVSYVDASVAGVTAAAGVTVQDEGVALSTAGTTVNFTGLGVTASGTGATKTVNVPGGVAVQDDGVALTGQAAALDFVGSGVTASGAGTTKTITIPGADPPGVTVQDEGTPLDVLGTVLNFTGAGVTATGNGATKTIAIPGGGSALEFQDEGVPLSQRPAVNFTGVGVTVTDDFANGRTRVEIPGSGLSAGADYVWTGKHQFRGVVVTNEWLDPRDTRFAGGAPANGTDDDQPALQALIDTGIGDQSIGRAAKVVLPPRLVLKSPVTIRRKAVAFEGHGWSPEAGGGTTIDWLPAGTDNRSMFIFEEQFGSSMKRMRFRGNKTASKTPIAALQFNAPASGTVQYNTGFVGELLWFGRYSGHDDPAVALGTGTYLTKGIHTTGPVNVQNDMSEWTMCFFGHVGTGVHIDNSQAVGHNFQNCKWYYCGAGIDTDADITVINPYFAHSSVTDLRSYIARVYCLNYESEFAKRMAINDGAAEFIFQGGYFQVGTSLNADGFIYYDINDTRTALRISDFDFRQNSDHLAAENALSVARARLAVQVSQVGPIPHKHIELNNVNWGEGGVRQNFPENRLATDPHLGDITVWGHLQGAIDASQHGREQSFYNFLYSGNTTLDFRRDDRQRMGKSPTRLVAGVPTDASFPYGAVDGDEATNTATTPPTKYVRVSGTWTAY